MSYYIFYPIFMLLGASWIFAFKNYCVKSEFSRKKSFSIGLISGLIFILTAFLGSYNFTSGTITTNLLSMGVTVVIFSLTSAAACARLSVDELAEDDFKD